jgi:hypothetical protein
MLFVILKPGANPTIVSCNAGAVKNYNAGAVKNYNAGAVKKYNAGAVKNYNAGAVKNYNAGAVKKYNAGAVKNYNASAVKNYNAASSLVHFENNFFFYNDKCPSLLQRWSRIGSRVIFFTKCLIMYL